MAWAVKYRTEFTDILGLDWKIDIEEDAWGGAITTMETTGQPLNIEYLSPSDDLHDSYIRGSVVNLNIYSDTNFQWLDLYATQEMQFRMSIYYGADVLYWRGYLINDNYSELYNATSYPVTISAADGFGLLKEIFYDDAGTYYNGRRLESQIILDILGKIGITSFTEYINIYEESMVSTATDSPFDQLKIDVDVFKDKYCYEVLEEILKKYHAHIRQVAGSYIIYRPTDLGAAVYGRTFTGASTKTAATNIGTDQLLSRTGAITDLRDLEGGTLMVHAPAKKITVHQDYGNKESWIDNWQFKGETLTAGVFDYWTNDTDTAVKHISELLASEKQGCAIYPTSLAANTVRQTFGGFSVNSATDKLIIDLYCNWYNDTGSASAATNLTAFITQGSYYLAELNDTEADWTLTPTALFSIIPNDIYGGTDIPVEWGDGWIHFKREFYGFPGDGDITIQLGTSGYTDIYNCYKDVKFYASSYKIVKKTGKRKLRERLANGAFFEGVRGLLSKYYTVDQKEAVDTVVEHNYTSTNAINGNDLEYDMILGDVPKASTPASDADTGIDNVTEQFAGALACSDDTYTTDWNTRGGSESKALLQIIGDQIAAQFARPRQFLSLPILEDAHQPADVIFSDWFLPSLYELLYMQQNLKAEGVGNFVEEWYWSSSEDSNIFAHAIHMLNGANAAYNKATSTNFHVRACRSFTSTEYSLRDTGPAGGLIFYIDGTTCYEAAPSDLLTSHVWSNVGSTEIGVTAQGEAVGTGITNTAAIIGQIGHTDSAAKHCSDYVLDNTPSPDINPHLNLLGNVQDSLNQTGGNNRKFVFNKGSFNVRDREWSADLIEII